jgi:hypothetical protein
MPDEVKVARHEGTWGSGGKSPLFLNLDVEWS